jgi:hypothetical protein
MKVRILSGTSLINGRIVPNRENVSLARRSCGFEPRCVHLKAQYIVCWYSGITSVPKTENVGSTPTLTALLEVIVKWLMGISLEGSNSSASTFGSVG